MNAQNVFCTWVFDDPQYVIAAITAVKSYRDAGGKLPFWCMWATLSEENVELLGKYFDRIIEMPILSRDMPKYQSQRKDEMYGHWIHRSFTKLNCFNPALISPPDVKLVCMVDADILFMKDPDSIFDDIGPNSQGIMPIGVVCDTPYTIQYKIKQPFVHNGTNGPRKYRHGENVPTRQIFDCMKSWRCVPGYIVIFAPNITHWNNFNELFNEFIPGRTLLGYDEQLLGHIVAAHKFVVNISPGYAWHVGKTKWYSGEVWCQHYAAGHPWLMKSGDYVDVTQWWDAWNRLLSDASDPSKIIALLEEVRGANQDTIEFNEKTRQLLLIYSKIDKDGNIL